MASLAVAETRKWNFPGEISENLSKNGINILKLPILDIQTSDPLKIQYTDLTYAITRFHPNRDPNLIGLAFKVSCLFEHEKATGTFVVYQNDSNWNFHWNVQKEMTRLDPRSLPFKSEHAQAIATALDQSDTRAVSALFVQALLSKNSGISLDGSIKQRDYPEELVRLFKSPGALIHNLPVLEVSDNMLVDNSDDDTIRFFPHNIDLENLSSPIMRFSYGFYELLGLVFKVSYTVNEQEETGTFTVFQSNPCDSSFWYYHLNSNEGTDDSEEGIYNPLIFQILFEPHKNDHTKAVVGNILPSSCNHCPDICKDLQENPTSGGITIAKYILTDPNPLFKIVQN